MPGSYRSEFQERDESGYIQATGLETGAMVIKSSRGPIKPVKCKNQEDVLINFGNPSATYKEIFEALAFVKESPIWVGSAIGANSYYGGVDVTASAVVAFGGGRVDPDNFIFTNATQKQSYSAGSGDGTTAQYTGTIPNFPVVEGTLKIKVGNTYINMTDSGGAISGTDIDAGGTNTIVYATGVYDFTLDGTVGIAATLTGNVAQTFDLQTNKYANITIDQVLYENIDLSDGAVSAAAVTVTEVMTAINNIIVSNPASVSTDYVKLTGVRGSLNYGNVKVEDPTLGSSALSTVFSSGGGAIEAKGTDPVGAIAKYGQSVAIEYSYTDDISATVSHSFFAASPYVDTLSVEIENIADEQFSLNLYETLNGQYIKIAEYEYSLIREQNGTGKQLYIDDVFDKDPYLIPKLNDAYLGTTPALTQAIVDLDGGDRGDEPSTGNYATTWDYFKKPNKYPAKIFMDTNGNSASYINDIITTYQYYSHGISIIPMDNDSDAAITYRGSLGIDSDNVSLYTNWRKIYDIYNDSQAWISNVGSIGRKYAQMDDVFDGKSPAGTDENGLGGQISDWTTIEMEYDYDDTELKDLDLAQINPVIFDQNDGVKIYGDKTLQVGLSDTSYIHTRRLYNVILETVVKQVLRKQEFKNNDSFHRLKAFSQVDTFMTPILAQELVREYLVICDTSNNTDVELEQRKFIVDIIVKATPNSQKCLLRLTRTGQGAVLADVIPQ